MGAGRASVFVAIVVLGTVACQDAKSAKGVAVVEEVALEDYRISLAVSDELIQDVRSYGDTNDNVWVEVDNDVYAYSQTDQAAADFHIDRSDRPTVCAELADMLKFPVCAIPGTFRLRVTIGNYGETPVEARPWCRVRGVGGLIESESRLEAYRRDENSPEILRIPPAPPDCWATGATDIDSVSACYGEWAQQVVIKPGHRFQFVVSASESRCFPEGVEVDLIEIGDLP